MASEPVRDISSECPTLTRSRRRALHLPRKESPMAKFNLEQAKEGFVLAIKTGASVDAACKAVGRSRKTYENWRTKDKDFAAKVDAARERRENAAQAGRDPDLYSLTFAEWRERFLGLETYPHQQLWIDVLEGRKPTLMHPTVRYEPRGENERI